jgi:catechol 2,3-dioxygenase-like lactoylglutathione lyase family enzyme
MSLSAYRVRASIAVSDIDRAARFYEEQLGLTAVEAHSNESRIYACAGDTSLHVYRSAGSAGTARGTVATWYVSDLEQVVDALQSTGVTFERYDDPGLRADDKGIHELDDGRVAWFMDPDGNTFALEERGSIGLSG